MQEVALYLGSCFNNGLHTPPLTLLTPAKINFYLHLLGKRPDGFHEIETLMAPLDWGDTLEIGIKEKGRPFSVELTCSDSELPTGPSNLAYRAAELFCEHFHHDVCLHLHIEKRIPVGAGLGGGSSNAASVLLGLRDLLDPTKTNEELAEQAASLGSDVPFFIYRSPACCRGRGEIIEPFQLQHAYNGLLVHPGFSVSTAWAYQAYASQVDQRGAASISHESAIAMPDGFFLHNDLETPVFAKYLWLPTVRKWLGDQPEVLGAQMSGSGSALFALTSTPEAALRLKESFFSEWGSSFLAQEFHIPITS